MSLLALREGEIVNILSLSTYNVTGRPAYVVALGPHRAVFLKDLVPPDARLYARWVVERVTADTIRLKTFGSDRYDRYLTFSGNEVRAGIIQPAGSLTFRVSRPAGGERGERLEVGGGWFLKANGDSQKLSIVQCLPGVAENEIRWLPERPASQ